MLRLLWLCLPLLGCASAPAERELLLFRLQHGQVDRTIDALDRAQLLDAEGLYVVFSGTDQGRPQSASNGAAADLLLLEAPPATMANARDAILGLQRGDGSDPLVLGISRAVQEWRWMLGFDSWPASAREPRGVWVQSDLATARQSIPAASETTLLCFLGHGALESVLGAADPAFLQLVQFQWSWAGDLMLGTVSPEDTLLLAGPTARVESARLRMMQADRPGRRSAVEIILRLEPEADMRR